MSRRLWRDLISAVVVFVVLPPVLLWWALTAGLIWPFNDNYYDPHTEISKSYHRHPDAFHDAAYHLLAQAQQHPNALRAQSGASYGQATWYLDTVDAKTGEQTTKKLSSGELPVLLTFLVCPADVHSTLPGFTPTPSVSFSITNQILAMTVSASMC